MDRRGEPISDDQRSWNCSQDFQTETMTIKFKSCNNKAFIHRLGSSDLLRYITAARRLTKILSGRKIRSLIRCCGAHGEKQERCLRVESLPNHSLRLTYNNYRQLEALQQERRHKGETRLGFAPKVY